MIRAVALPSLLAVACTLPATALGQSTEPSTPASTQPAAAQAQTAAAVVDDPDLDFQALQPDFNLINLPTTLRVPRYKSAFRVTHRFTRSLNEGSFTELLEDFLSFDSSAQIGLEYRFGLMRGTQVGIRRTNDRTIEFFTEHSLMQQNAGQAIGLAAYAAIEGTNNFRDSYSPILGAIVSRTVGRFATVYVEPVWVNNSNPLPSEVVDDNNTFLLGLGGRVRILRTVYFTAEIIPRIAGDDPGVNYGSFAIEKVVGGHGFQLNFSNTIGTMWRELAQGAASNDDWYLGFNISRKFF